MDVRFLPNPHWEDDLRPLTGHDPKVRDFVLETAVGSAFVDQFDDLLGTLVPQYQAEGRSYLTVAHRLHRRPPPLGRRRRGARRAPAPARRRRADLPPRRRALTVASRV